MALHLLILDMHILQLRMPEHLFQQVIQLHWLSAVVLTMVTV